VAWPSAARFLHCALSQSYNLSIIAKDWWRLLYIASSTDIHKLRVLTIHQWYTSIWNSRGSCIQKLGKYWCILSYILLTLSFRLVLIALTVTTTFWPCLIDCCVGRTNLGMIGAALTSRYSGHSGTSMQLPCPISDLTSAVQLSSLSVGLSRLPLQLSRFSGFQIFGGALSSSVSTGWLLSLLIWRTFNNSVCPVGRSFEMIPPVQQLPSPDQVRPGPMQSIPRNL